MISTRSSRRPGTVFRAALTLAAGPAAVVTGVALALRPLPGSAATTAEWTDPLLRVTAIGLCCWGLWWGLNCLLASLVRIRVAAGHAAPAWAARLPRRALTAVGVAAGVALAGLAPAQAHDGSPGVAGMPTAQVATSVLAVLPGQDSADPGWPAAEAEDEHDDAAEATAEATVESPEPDEPAEPTEETTESETSKPAPTQDPRTSAETSPTREAKPSSRPSHSPRSASPGYNTSERETNEEAGYSPIDGFQGPSARATDPTPSPDPTPLSSPLPEPAHRPALAPPSGPAQASAPGKYRAERTAPDLPAAFGTPRRDEVVVAPGDSLWSVAAERLGPAATAEDIAREWPRWYHSNREAIGEDPDLLRPGTRLLPPAG